MVLVSSVGMVAGATNHYINYTVSSSACKPISAMGNGVWNGEFDAWYNSDLTAFYKPDTYLKCMAYFFNSEGDNVGSDTIQLSKDDDTNSVLDGMLLVPGNTSFILFQMYSGVFNTSTGNPFTAMNPGKFNGKQQYYHVNFYDPSLVNGGCPSLLSFDTITNGECGGLTHYTLTVYGGSVTQV